MYTDTEGIILRQIKTLDNRRMILLFSRKYGKISAGTNISERGKNKSALAIRPFTYGKYELFKGHSGYNINGAEAKRSFFGIGEDIDKFMIASYILEFTNKILPEDHPSERLFDLLLEFMDILEERKSNLETIALAYQMKAFALMGIAPQLRNCVECNTKGEILHERAHSEHLKVYFSVKDGGIICSDCRNNMQEQENVSLIYPIDFGIVDILRYFAENPLGNLRKIGLEESVQKKVLSILKAYAKYHLDIKELKSDEFSIGNL